MASSVTADATVLPISVSALVLVAIATPARAHEGLSVLASWGDFGDAAPCLRTVADAAATCAAAAIAARRTCYDRVVTGGICDATAVAAAVREARGRALDAVEARCSERQALGLKATGVADLLGDTVRACRALENGVVAGAYAPLLDGDTVRAGGATEARCVTAAAAAAAKLGRHAAGTWQRAFDALAGRALAPQRKEAVVAHAALRVGRARTAVARLLAARCPEAEFAQVYGQSAAQFVAGIAVAADCFAEGVYQQAAVTCAPAAAAPASAGWPCQNGYAGQLYPCRNVDLMAYLPFANIGGGQGNDVWGWTDSATGHEYALMGRTNGMSVVDVTTPTQPVYLGNLPPHTVNSTWRGIKVYRDHAFVASEAYGHGMQVLDLAQVRSLGTTPVTFAESAYYGGFSNCHTLALNEETGYAYCAGTNTCGGGLHIVDVSNPLAPTFAGCVSSDGYTHETQCVVYHGPDAAYAGREICLSSNADTLTIIDVTSKAAPVQVSRTGYQGRGYAHQGWLTDDHRYLLMDDELDEGNFGHNTRTLIWDVGDLDAPFVLAEHFAATAATDHNQYIARGHSFQANYRAGLRVLSVADVASGVLNEVGFFDIFPTSDANGYAGAWSNYPFFASGTVLIGGIESGLFVVRPDLAGTAPSPTPPPTSTRAATRTPTATGTATLTPTRTPIPVIVLDPIAAPLVVGGTLGLTGSGFTAGSVAVLFIASAGGVYSPGGLAPMGWSPGALTVALPPTLPLGNGFATVVVVNADQGFAQSNPQSQLLLGDAADGLPSITAVDGVGLDPVSDGVPMAVIETVLTPGAVIGIDGSGFDDALVNLFVPGGAFAGLAPQPGATATHLDLLVPASAPVGPAALQVVNQPYVGAVVSNAVAVVIGARLGLDSVTQEGTTVRVRGAGFSAWTVINLFNQQGNVVVNLGGLDAQGGPAVPFNFLSSTEFTFAVPVGAADGPAYLQILNPPFIAFSSTGADPDGAFHLSAP